MNNNENQEVMTYNETLDLLQRLSGLGSDGGAKSVLSYMLYNSNDRDADGTPKATAITLEDCVISVFINKSAPEFINVDIDFEMNETEQLEKMWSDLLYFKQTEDQNPENPWVFFVNITETDTIQFNKNGDNIISLNAANPILYTTISELATTESSPLSIRLVFYAAAMSCETLSNFNSSEIMDAELDKLQ